MRIDPGEWRAELAQQGDLYMRLYDRLPKEPLFQRELLIARI